MRIVAIELRDLDQAHDDVDLHRRSGCSKDRVPRLQLFILLKQGLELLCLAGEYRGLAWQNSAPILIAQERDLHSALDCDRGAQCRRGRFDREFGRRVARPTKKAEQMSAGAVNLLK
jgi:hypothetical protein